MADRRTRATARSSSAPLEDHGPYGYLTHFVLVLTPCAADEELPADDEALRRWVVDRING